MPLPNGTMVQVTNDKIPWYGQTLSYLGGVYTVRVGGTNVTVDIAEANVSLHPLLLDAENRRQQQIAIRFGKLTEGSQKLKMIDTFPDIIGTKMNNALADTITGKSESGTILTLCNVNALLTLMWPSPSHVVVVDNDSAKIKDLWTLVELAEQSDTMIDWYCKVFERFGKALLNTWVSKYRPHYKSFLALKQCRGRLHLILQDLADGNAIEAITKVCACKCVKALKVMYVSNIEYYLFPGGAFCQDKEAIVRYKKNILSLMLDDTVLIRSDSVMMKVNDGKAEVEKIWNS